MPFKGYDNFQQCVDDNQDKDDPEAFCAWLEQQSSQSGSNMEGKMELRAVRSDIKSDSTDGEINQVSGLGIVTEEWAEIMPGFKERIRKGAVKLADTVKSYVNHDPNQVLATSQSDPPLQVEETNEGWQYSSPIPPTSYGNDLRVNLERQNVKGSSFAFMVGEGGDRMWEGEDGNIYRDISEVNVFELGPVTDPAYLQTTAQLRSAKEALEGWKANQEPQQLEIPYSRILRQKRQSLVESDL